MKGALQFTLFVVLSAIIGNVANSIWRANNPVLIDSEPSDPSILAEEAFATIADAQATRSTFTARYRTMMVAELLDPSQFESLSLLMANQSGNDWSDL